MPGPLDRRLRIRLPQDRVVRRGLIGAQKILRAGDVDAVPVAGPAFREDRVIVLAAPEEMRPLRAALPGAFPHGDRLAGHPGAVVTERQDPDAGTDDKIMLSVLVDEMRGIDAVHFQLRGPRVRAFRAFRGDHQLAPEDRRASLPISIEAQRRHDDIAPVTVRDVRRPDPVGIPDVREIGIVRIRQRMADQFPVHQVLRVTDRDARKILESRIDHIIIGSHPHNGGIRIEAS